VIRILAILSILLSFTTAIAADFGCLCIEDASAHAIEQEADHSQDNQTSKADHVNHCHHRCAHHLVTLEPKNVFQPLNTSYKLQAFISGCSSPRAVALSLYRPPIA
jgi:L-cystine uptake protein TcyP (sodium:dicarboxylate symporter family)